MNSTDPSCDFLLLDTIRELREQVKALEARLAEAVEVLRPFARQGKELDIHYADYGDICLVFNDLSHGDFRAARRLYEKEDGRG